MRTSDPHLRQLLRSVVLLVALGAIVAALLAAVPGLASVARELGHAQAGWVVLAVVAELASGLAFVFFFQGVFWRGPRMLAARLGWTEMAADSLLPVGGAGGVGMGAWILGKLGMPGRAVAIRSSVVFLITSAVSRARAVAVRARAGDRSVRRPTQAAPGGATQGFRAPWLPVGGNATR